MTLLNQIVAIEKGVKNKAQRVETELYHGLQKPALMQGISRVYTPKDEEGDQLPSERTLVQVKAPQVLDNLAQGLTRMFDVVFTKEYANTEAVADVLVNGVVLIESVPVGYLLFLEKELDKIATFVSKIPTLDPSEVWEFDADLGVYRTQPTETIRQKKIPRNHVKAEATDKHPAQVEIYTEDVLVGTWATTKFSGGLPQTRIDEVLGRVDTLKTAVKFAREQANTYEVEDRTAGAAVFNYLFA